MMLAVSNILRPPPARLGKISDDLVLPRTIEVRKLLAVSLGAFIGVLFWIFILVLLFRQGFYSMLISATIGGLLGFLAVSWSPIKGESLTRWVSLVGSKYVGTAKVRVEGERVRAYLGVAPLSFVAAGTTRVRPGAIEVPLGSVDERGVPYNVDDMRKVMRLHAAELNLPPFPTDDGFETPKHLPIDARRPRRARS
jgi:hypothetical protein